MNPDDVDACLRVLRAIEADRGHLAALAQDTRRELLTLAGLVAKPERHDLVYWSTGLTPVFLEGALQRARTPVTVRTRAVEVPISQAPAQKTFSATRVMPPGPEPVLDPFEIGTRNLDVLKQELGALNRPRLLNIIEAYDLNPGGENLTWMSDRQLVQFIVSAVDAQLIQRAR